MLTAEERQTLYDIHQDPLRFSAFYWPDLKLYDKQVEVLESVRDNKLTFVPAGAGLGKDFITSIAVLWFFRSRNPCKIVVSSASEDHLWSVLWAEIQERINTARGVWEGRPVRLPFKVDYLRVQLFDGNNKLDPQSWILGRVTNKAERVQGVHLDQDKPRVMAIFDEASGIASEFFDAYSSWAHRILAISNPMNTVNFFYQQCKKGDAPNVHGQGLYRKVIQIGAEDSPNVKWGLAWKARDVEPPPPMPEELRIPGLVNYEEYCERLANWDEFNIKTRLHGRFFEDQSSMMFPEEWLDLAAAAARELGSGRRAKVIGVDAGEGRSDSVWTAVDEFGIIEQVAKKTPNTMDIAGFTIEFMRKHSVPADKVYFDRGGGGKQIADRLREQRYKVQTVGFGEPASPPLDVRQKRMEVRKDVQEVQRTYKNRRAEMYGMLREEINPLTLDGQATKRVFGIPAELNLLRAELAPLPLMYDSEGRCFLPPKNRPPGVKATSQITIFDLLGHSPDRADSLVLAMYGLKAKARRKIGAL